MVEERQGPLCEVALAGHTHMVVGPLAVGRPDKGLVPEMLNTPKTVTEMGACGAHRNDAVRQGNDAAVADPGMVPAEELANEEPLVGLAVDVEVIDAEELSWPERLLNAGGRHHATLAVDLRTYLCMI